MEQKRDILSRINESFGRMSKGQKKIATFVLEHYDQAAFMTAAKLGETVGVSESTVVRFATHIGYEGFPEFHVDLVAWMKDKMNAVQQIGDKYAGSSQSDILNSVIHSDIERLKYTLRNMDVAAFESAVDILIHAKHVYVVGIRSCEPLAAFLCFYLKMIRGDVIQVTTTNVSEMFEQMIRVGKKDAVVGISFPRYSMRTLKAMEFANDRNAKVITVTDTIHSPMNLYSSCNLLARSDMTSIVDSLVAPLSVINALVVALCLKAPEEVKANLKELEFTWNNYQVYLNDEINFIDDEPVLDYPLWKEQK